MPSHDLELGTVVRTDVKKELMVEAINGPLVVVKYPNGNLAGVIDKITITHVKVGEVWEEYTQ